LDGGPDVHMALGVRLLNWHDRLWQNKYITQRRPLDTVNKSRFIQNELMIHKEVEGEIIILNPENGDFFNLNGIASCIWSFLETAQTVDSVVALISEGMDTPVETCTPDVTAFFEQMSDQGLITCTENLEQQL